MNMNVKKLMFAVGMISAVGAVKGSGTDSIAQITWETLPRYCSSNIGLVKEPVKGIIVEHHGLGDDAIVVSTGGSMGGLGCLVWARYSQHRIAAVVANCPVTDLAYHYTERPDLPRTIGCAFADAPDLQAAIMAHSPLHLVKSMPDIPYFIVHSTSDEAVNKERHSDRFVAAMEAAGRKIEYLESEGTGHCQLRPEVQARFDAALLLPFKAKCN